MLIRCTVSKLLIAVVLNGLMSIGLEAYNRLINRALINEYLTQTIERERVLSYTIWGRVQTVKNKCALVSGSQNSNK